MKAYLKVLILMVFIAAVIAGVLDLIKSSEYSFLASLNNIQRKQSEEVKDRPIFLSASIEPKKVAPGDNVIVTVEIKDDYGITEVKADMGGIANIMLELIEGDIKQGIWQGNWLAYGTEPQNYQTMVFATNAIGKQSSISINWEDPTITDSFTDESMIASSENITVSGGQVKLSEWQCGSSFTYGGQSYDTVSIGGMCWLTENLNIAPASADNGSCSSGTKYCYSNNPDNCTTYGGLYNWTDMMCGASPCNGTGESQPACTTPVQGLCPDGWHIPSHYEWVALERAVCASGTCSSDFPYDTSTTGDRGTDEGSRLAGNANLWANGTLDSEPDFGVSGFDALPAGVYVTFYTILSYGTSFSSSTEHDSTHIKNRHITYSKSTIARSYDYKTTRISLRCLMD